MWHHVQYGVRFITLEVYIAIEGMPVVDVQESRHIVVVCGREYLLSAYWATVIDEPAFHAVLAEVMATLGVDGAFGPISRLFDIYDWGF